VWKIPSFLRQGERQLSIEDANDSRLVTKTSWIVKSRNGHSKTIFKFLDRMIPIRNMWSYY